MRLIDADGVIEEIKKNKLLAREPATERGMEIIKNATTYVEPTTYDVDKVVEQMSRVLPILFNTDMVQAILDGRKTVTRRVIKPCNPFKSQGYKQGDGLWIDGYGDGSGKEAEGHIKDYSVGCCWIGKDRYIEKYAPCKPGDILYVRETWQVFQTYPGAYGFDVSYRADQYIRPCIFTPERYEKFIKYEDSKNYPRWISSQFMPKEAARVWLKVTDVRVERLQDVTTEQIIKEGANQETIKHYIAQMPEETEEWIEAAHKLEWQQLWDSTIKKPDIDLYGWEANPWVWVIEFERCEKPEGI